MSKVVATGILLISWLSVSVYTSSSRLLPPALDITKLKPAGQACAADLVALRQALDSGEPWALAMWDAGVKSPAGLMSQTAIQFGDFDTCIAVSSPVRAQYCLLDVAPSPATNNTLWTAFKWAVCVPASCSSQDLQVAVQGYMDEEGGGERVSMIPGACTTGETASRPLTIADIIMCLIIAAIVMAVAAATVHDIMTDREYDGVSPPTTWEQCLSARRGWNSLFRPEDPVPGLNLRPLYGLHFITICLVVFGHRFGVHLFFMTLTNYRAAENVFSNPWLSMWAGHADLIVEFFFIVSAFLLSLVYTAQLHKRYVSPLKVFAYRIFRLWPAYVLVIGFYVTLMRHMGDGPIWNILMDAEQSICRRTWWTNLLFINNYVDKENLCIPQSWYITCEFQLYLIGTLLVLLLQRNRSVGLVVMAVAFLGCVTVRFLATYLTDRPAFMLFYREFWSDVRHHDVFSTVYSQVQYRLTSYLPGLLTGYYVYSTRDTTLSKASTYSLQGAAFALGLPIWWSGAFFTDLKNPPNHLVTALYAALFHTFFGFVIGLKIISLTRGTSTFISRFLSWRGFIPLSKLTYCVYLIHLIPMFEWVGTARTPAYLHIHALISWTIADLTLCLTAALVMNLTVEAPVRYLVKRLISGSPTPPPPQPKRSEPLEEFNIQDMPKFP